MFNFRGFARRNVRVLQAVAAIAAIVTATYTVILRDYVAALTVPPPMIETVHVAVTNRHYGITQFIRSGGGAWSDGVDLRKYPSVEEWNTGVSGVAGVMFKRNHSQCDLTAFTARLVDSFNLAIQLVRIDITDLYIPTGSNVILVPFTVPKDILLGEYEISANISYNCKGEEFVSSFPQPVLIVKG